MSPPLSKRRLFKVRAFCRKSAVIELRPEALAAVLVYVSAAGWFYSRVRIWRLWWKHAKAIPDGTPATEMPPFPLSAREQFVLGKLLGLAHTWLAPALLGLVFGMGMVAALRALPTGSWHPWSGSAVSIFKALCLAGAGYLHLDASWRFLTENIHRYIGMHRIFQRTGDRLGNLLDRMDAADAAGRIEEHNRLRDEVHELLATLGRDALDENSDWFVLHRTHPVAPINLH